MRELPEGLLEEAKNYFDITWDDPDGDSKLSGILLRGMAYLERIAGDALDFAADDQPRELLLEYARYVRSNALEDFQGNYRHELVALQLANGGGGIC